MRIRYYIGDWRITGMAEGRQVSLVVSHEVLGCENVEVLRKGRETVIHFLNSRKKMKTYRRFRSLPALCRFVAYHVARMILA